MVPEGNPHQSARPAQTETDLELPSRGPADAPVTMTVFEDYQWGYCARLEPTLQQVLDQFPETVRLVVKPLPTAGQQISWFAASAVLAAHAQGYFWDFRDLLFQNEGVLTAADLGDIAEEIGLDLPRYHRDLASPVIQRLLVAGIAEAEALGVTGTPTITINQKRLEDLHFDALRKAVEQAAPRPPTPQ